MCEFYRWFFVDLFPNHFGVYAVFSFILGQLALAPKDRGRWFRLDPKERPSLSDYKPKWLLVLAIVLLFMPIVEGVFVGAVCGKNIWMK